MALTLILILVLFFISVPIALALGIAPLAALWERGMPLIVVPQTVFEALDSFALMAVPFYVLAGKLMDQAGIAQRLINFAYSLVNWFRGGLGSASVLSTMFFSTISGSSSATAAAIGTVLIPRMKAVGYPKPFAAAIVASSAELGVILPPSVPMIIYGVVTGVSITDLFIAGIIPGIMIGVSLILTVAVVARLRKYGKAERMGKREWAGNVWASFRKALLSLCMPIIILGGIYLGVFTATEAAVVAVVFAFMVGKFVYGSIAWRDLPGIFSSAALTSAVVLVIVGFAAVLAYALSLFRAPQQVAELMLSVSENPLVFLLLVNILLLVVGMFMETFAAIIVLAPVLAPVAALMGINPIHFALVMITNLAIGMVTPPVGVNLFIACSVAGIRVEEIVKPLLIFLAVLLANLMVITYVPMFGLPF
ncbi:TRAP transporter large permease [Nitratireductor aquimarinus]|uniref:TRAP transporter large permease n=1 Tax=Nitratireductor TaxID=245876 RepID=UPI0019D3B6EC|nr:MULTISPECIES: TRAP transporter large permease [Nitratireductor]MBN7776251.1 TRAP transporter large permease [Nitratireductor pacificus]MBN7779118.1 TRAP transporter large permease [Nitratireductor pacificus]MBN7787925.1 TRAP transporter large permease [Nitratireductor aquimarinus]MBY6097972.1 TRAP transporter large permease [Nitratireductor aquimarinus]MCA1259840.1 TRAP transporter large permease [Nitratireductor aquimarinus]